MQLRNSLTKLGLMATFVALLFISCKKDDTGKEEEVDDTVGTATAMIKVDNEESVKFELIPISEYRNFGDDAQPALMRKNGNFAMILTNNSNIADEGPGMKLVFYCHSIEEGKEHKFSEKDSDLEIGLDDEERMVVIKGNTIGYYPPNGQWASVFQVLEDNGAVGSGKLKITSLTNDRVKGTFSANMHNREGQKAVVSEGKFDLPLKREK